MSEQPSLTTTDPAVLTGAFDLMTQPAPGIPDATAAALARTLFDVEGVVRPLTSERDQNFLISKDDDHWVLKISNAHEDPAVTDFQTRAVMHALARDPGLPLPPFRLSREDRFVETFTTADSRHAARMLRFVAGRPLKEMVEDASITLPGLSHQLGALLARLTKALEDFQHPAEDHAILWDLSHFTALEPLLENVTDTASRDAISACFQDYREARTTLGNLPRQVIYNDLNDSNVLIDTDGANAISGLIDFGDVVRAPRIFDVAVAASYRMAERGSLRTFLDGYTSQLPLAGIERALLPMLIRARLATTMLITQWRAARFPHNRAYILRNYPSACAALLDFRDSMVDA